MARFSMDVMQFPAEDRHSAIFRAFDTLAIGESIELRVDHDPRRLYSQFFSQRSGAFAWNYLESGPTDWRIELIKTSNAIKADSTDEEGCCGCCGVR